MDYREQLQQSQRLTRTAKHSQAVVDAVIQDNESLQSLLEKAVSDIEARDILIASQAQQLSEKDAEIARLNDIIRLMREQKPIIKLKDNHGVITDTIQSVQATCPSTSITTTEQLLTPSRPSSSPTKRLSSHRQPALVPSL